MNGITHLPQELLSCKTDFDLQTEIVVANVNEEESTMNDQAVHYFLDEILKKKKELHDPRHRCNRFYGEIRELLIKRHGLSFSVKTLERKFHYLKRQFDTLCQNSNRPEGTSKGPINWSFFHKMMEIFSEELAIEDAPTMASLYPDLPLPKSALPIPQVYRAGNVTLDKVSEEENKAINKSLEDDTKETIWNHTVVLDFLNECVQKKAEFWDPDQVRRDIFLEIQNRMQAKGYTFQLETLDRKLRNLKTCYHGTVRSMQKKDYPENGTHRWPYFVQLHELYNGYEEEKAARKKNSRKPTAKYSGVVRKKSVRKARSKYASHGRNQPASKIEFSLDQPTTTTRKFRPRRTKPDPFQQFHLPAPDVLQSSFEIEQKTSETLVDTKCPLSPGDLDSSMQEDESITHEEFEDKTNRSTESSAEDIADDYQFSQKMLALEERRTIATEQLLEQIKESNRIRQKKLEFNRKKLSYLQARAKRKQLL